MYLGSGNGGKLKAVYNPILNPTDNHFSRWTDPNIGATNSSRFTARPAGVMVYDGVYEHYTHAYYPTSRTYFWANTGTTTHYYFYLRSDDAGVWSNPNSTEFACCSIRLVKNSTTLSDGQMGTYTGNDGRTYPTICIGTQEWLQVNLAETRFSNGELIPYSTATETDDPFIYMYNNLPVRVRPGRPFRW
jgi:hypothetical protein